MTAEDWIDVMKEKPPMQRFISGQGWVPRAKPYVLAVDVKGRTSVGYAVKNATGYDWTFAKPIGEPTHWMHIVLPNSVRVHESYCGLDPNHTGNCTAVVTRLLGV